MTVTDRDSARIDVAFDVDGSMVEVKIEGALPEHSRIVRLSRGEARRLAATILVASAKLDGASADLAPVRARG